MSKNVCHPAKPLESGTVGWVLPRACFALDKPNEFPAVRCAFVVAFCIEGNSHRVYTGRPMNPALKNCMFCGLAKKMTSEHVWGEWTKGWVARTANKHNHANVFVPRPGEPEPAKVRIRAGDHLDAQVYVVCAECNSGVLSQIQNEAKPILISLFERAKITLDPSEQQLVATWIAMATMTGEFLSQDEARIAVPQSDRTWLMEKRTPPPGWCIWTGHYPRLENPTQWVKASFPVVDADELPDTVTDRDLAPTLQTTAYSVGTFSPSR
jgi:hypothetical protein